VRRDRHGVAPRRRRKGPSDDIALRPSARYCIAMATRDREGTGASVAVELGAQGRFDEAACAAALRAACRQLTTRDDASAQIERFVWTMVNLARNVHSQARTPQHAVSVVGKAACERELRSVNRHARALAEALDGLHEPTILALAHVRFNSAVRVKLPAMLRQLADLAERAVIEDQPCNAGRGAKPHSLAHGIARLTGHAYRDLSGRRPTYTSDPGTSARRGAWPDFLEAVFLAIGVTGYGDRLVRLIAKEMNSPK
jgi:hypothetical protein